MKSKTLWEMITLKVIKHSSDNNPYDFRHYFYNIPENANSKNECDEEYIEILRAALNRYRNEHASRLLHEIAQCIFSSDNPEKTARMFFCAEHMYSLLKDIAGNDEVCTMTDITDLLTIIDGKDDA